MGRPETVVDYDAWKRGYMPPSEHVLIDQLSYRGARVVMSTDFGKHGAVWIVTRDIKNLSRPARRALAQIMHEAVDEQMDAFEKAEAAPPQVTGEMDTPSGPQVTNSLSHNTTGK